MAAWEERPSWIVTLTTLFSSSKYSQASDLDIAYARDHSNIEKLVALLRDVGATLRGAPSGSPFRLDAKTIENGSHLTFVTKYGSLDLLSDQARAPQYATLKAAATKGQIRGRTVLFASLDHLIAMKEAAGRTKDKLMATEYRVLSDELRAPNGQSREDLRRLVRPEDMPYSTYEDARAHERELLRLAQKHKIGSVPRRERRSIFRANRILSVMRERYAAVRKPAVGHAG